MGIKIVYQRLRTDSSLVEVKDAVKKALSSFGGKISEFDNGFEIKQGINGIEHANHAYFSSDVFVLKPSVDDDLYEIVIRISWKAKAYVWLCAWPACVFLLPVIIPIQYSSLKPQEAYRSALKQIQSYISVKPEGKSQLTAACPEHGNSDSLQRISALVAGGKMSGTFSGPSGGITYVDGKQAYTSGYSRLSGNLTSNIAETLSAPPEPQYADFWFHFIWWVLGYFSLILLFTVYFWWKAYQKAYTARKHYPEQYLIWKRATHKWNRLYYCHRCDIVIDPETNKTCTPSEFHEFLSDDLVYEMEKLASMKQLNIASSSNDRHALPPDSF